jgi:hypothetical protein
MLVEAGSQAPVPVGGNDMVHSFVVVVEGADFVGPDADVLYEAGCDDALLISERGLQKAIFDREAPSFAGAVKSAISAVETSIAGARVVAVERTTATSLGTCGEHS